MRISLFLAGGLPAGLASAFQAQSGYSGSTFISGRRQLGKPLTAVANVGAAINIQETAQRDVWSMDEWATQSGAQKAEGVELTSEDGIDWSFATSQDIPAGSPVVFVPNPMILSSNQVSQEFGASIAPAEDQLTQAGLADQVPLFRLFVKILAEYEMGDQSPFFPWLNSLPKRYNNGASMTYACFECLPPYVAWLSMKERVNLSNFGKALKFVRLSKQTVKNKNLIKWAYNAAVSRSIDMNGEKLIVPLADMFNHGTETEVDINYDEQGNCMVYATKDVPAGSPLRMSYGDPTNPSPLFATYGFLDESSPATFCKLMHLMKEMEELGMDFSNLLFYKDTGDISPEVYDLMLYHILASEPNLQQEFYHAYMSGDADAKSSYQQQYFSYTLDALKQHVDGILRELDSLSAKAYSKDPSTHPRIPVILKHNEFVKNTFLTVKASLDEM